MSDTYVACLATCAYRFPELLDADWSLDLSITYLACSYYKLHIYMYELFKSNTILNFLYYFKIFIDQVWYWNIDQALVNSLHDLLNCEMYGLDWRVITTEYILLSHVH